MSTVIKVENLSKQYRLGNIGTGTISHDVNRWWYKVRGKDDPYLTIGDENDRTKKGNSEYVWALRDINFEVKNGEVLGIIGRNGAGKSTLLKILSRTTSPTTGNVKIRGRVASLLEVGTGFHPELTGRENVFLNGAIMGMTKAEIKRKFDEIVDFSGVEKYIDTPVKRYSSGMYVRLAFGVAAHLEPEILIVDEVLAVGDAEFQKKALGKMKDVSNKDGRTVLFVSHNMVAIQNLCYRAMIIENGKAEQIEAVGKAINSYFKNMNSVCENGVINLRNATRSNGKYKVIEKAWIENSKNEIVSSIMMGENFIVKFEFNSTVEIANAIFGFGIENNQGMRITSLNNAIIGSEIPKKICKGIACCTFENISLMSGDYYVSISVVSNQNQWIDYIEQAIPFSIESKDVYSTGKLIENSQGFVYAKGNVFIQKVN